MDDDPLAYQHLFTPHQGRFLDLADVTTITIDDRTDKDTLGRIASITKWHRRFMRPAKEVVVSSEKPDIEGIEWVFLNKWGYWPRVAYSRWCQKELRNHFTTKMVLIWQVDGFAINPECWSPDFLGYDYIGSPMGPAARKSAGTVGNGGFSMRSKRFCDEASKLPDCGEVPEDTYFCTRQRDRLERLGVMFAPRPLAAIWGTEDTPPRHSIGATFGFHAKYNLRAAGGWINLRWLPRPFKMLKNGAVYANGRFERPQPVR